MKKLIRRFLIFINVASVLLLWGSAASVYVSPTHWKGFFEFYGLAFPFFLATVIGAMLLCFLCFQSKLILIGFVGLAGCFGSLRSYFPINLSAPAPKGSIKVMSYNTHSLGSWRVDENDSINLVLKYIVAKQPDIVALQEGYFKNANYLEEMKRYLKLKGYNHDWTPIGSSQVALVSKYDIVSHEVICQSDFNGASCFKVLRAPHDTIYTIVCHLESMHLTNEDRSSYSRIAHNPDSLHEVGGKLTMLRRIAKSSQQRAMQADTIAHYIARLGNRQIIVMGDFNDTPISYSRQRIKGDLIDAYSASGNGIGRSFNRDAIYVRIDHIFCSERFRPFGAVVDETAPFSDHYPIVAYLKPIKP